LFFVHLDRTGSLQQLREFFVHKVGLSPLHLVKPVVLRLESGLKQSSQCIPVVPGFQQELLTITKIYISAAPPKSKA
jgi:hypothetical protein